MTNYYVGEREIPVTYDSSDCMARFRLEDVTYEYAFMEVGGRSVQEGPPFVMFTFRKLYEGDVNLLPQISIAQNKYRKGKATKKRRQIYFPFREKEMAAPVDDWSASGIEISVGAPGAIMDLYNPMEWAEIRINCE